MPPKKKKEQAAPAPPPPPPPDLSVPVLQDLGKLNPSSRSRIGMLPTASSLAPPPPAKDQLSESPSTADVTKYGRRAGSNSPDGLGYTPPTSYHAHDVKEYRKLQQQYSTQRWGGLGFVDTEEQKAAREKRARVFEYGKCVSQINAAILKASSPEPEAAHNNGNISGERQSVTIQRKLTEEAEVARLKRDRALHFFDKLTDSKWKVAVRDTPDIHVSPSPSRDREPFNDGPTPQLMPEQREALDQLQELLEKHRRDHETMLRIKRDLGMVTPTLPS
jgi:hypothetical protein